MISDSRALEKAKEIWKAWRKNQVISSVSTKTALLAWDNAKRAALVFIEWEELDGQISPTSSEESQSSSVRLTVHEDTHFSIEDLEGDCFDPSLNPDIDRCILLKEQNKFRERVEYLGVFGIVGEYWTGRCWKVADSVWGFVGEDWRGSGYDIDVMSSAIQAYKEQEFCPHCRQPLSS